MAYSPVYPGLYYFDTFTFTTLGTAGHRGPDSTKGYANAPWREGDFSIKKGIQQWTVPANGTYHIEAAGAYGATPGRIVAGDVKLNEGQVLSMLVGQQPDPLVANVADNVTVGGGGGTFIASDKLLMVASGGDGGAYNSITSSPASFTPSGNGNGFSGAGYFTDGQASDPYFSFVKPFSRIKGGFGNMYQYGIQEKGGFGGGQSPLNNLTNLISVSGFDNYNLTTCTAVTSVPHGYPHDYKVQITGTNSFNGTWDIVTTTPDTFTFQAVGGPSEGGGQPVDRAFAISQSPPGMIESIDGGVSWTVATLPAPDAEFPYFVTFINNKFIVSSIKISTYSTIVSISSDGTTWTSTEVNGLWLSFVYGNGLYTGVSIYGSILGYSSVMTSSDGISWTEVSGAPTGDFFSVTYGNGIFVAVEGNTSIGSIMYSSNGLSWAYANTPVLGNWLGVTYGNNLFVAVGVESSYVTTSTDGSNWTSHTSPFGCYDITYGNNLFVATGIDIITSSDGINWTTQITTGEQNAITYANGTFIATGTTIITSPNGTSWTQRTNPNPELTTFVSVVYGYASSPSINGKVSGTTTGISGGGGYTGSPGDGVSGATCFADSSIANFTDLGASNTVGYVVVSLIDPPPVQTAWSWNDRNNWTIEGIQLKHCAQVTWNANMGKFIAINDSLLPSVQTSSDAISWSTVNSNLPLVDLAHAIISVGRTTVLSSVSGLWSTQDAVTWTNTLSTARDYGVFVEAQPNIYFYSLANVYVSGDGYTWFQNPTPQLDYVAYDGKNFIGLTTDTLLYNSSNGTTWSQSSNSVGMVSVSALTYTNDAFVSAGLATRQLSSEVLVLVSNSDIQTSTDGYTWNAIFHSPYYTFSPNFAYGNNVFVVSTGNYSVLISSDTLTWTEVSTPISAYFIVYGNDTFIGLVSSLSGIAAMKSSDGGNTWSTVTLPDGYPWETITYGNDLFYIYGGSNDVATSPDGTIWTYITGSYFLKDSNSKFAYGNGRFVALSVYDGTVWNSSDGLNWSQSTLPNIYPSSVTFGNGIFVSVGQSNVITSTYGSSWTEQTIPSTVGVNAAVGYGNGIFTAIGYDGGLTSPDGVHWTSHVNTWGSFTNPTIHSGMGNYISNVGTISYSYTGNTWSNVDIYDPLTRISSLNNKIIGFNTNNIWYSSTLTQWNKNPVTFSLQNTIAPAPQLGYCALADLNFTYLSIDGRYVVHPVDNSGGFYQTTWSPQLGLFVGTGEGVISFSKDGKIWTAVSAPLLTGVSAIEWSSELGVFVTYCSGNSFLSPDGKTWTRYPAPSVSISSGHKILVWSKSLGLFTLGGVTVSNDGINWTTPTGSIVSPIAWSPSLSLFSSGTYYSRDGLTWSSTNLSFLPSSIAWGSKLATFLCVDGNGMTYTSKDGINWTTSFFNVNNQQLPTLFVTIPDTSSSDFYVSQDGNSWNPLSVGPFEDPYRWRFVNYANGTYTVYGIDDLNLTSTNGYTWTSHPTEINLTSVAYGNGIYIGLNFAGALFYISSDGVNFTATSGPQVSGWTAVAYGKGIFVTCANNYQNPPYIATSYDGQIWTIRNAPVDGYQTCFFAGGLFVAIGYDSVITSPDGIHWTQVVLPSGNWFNGAYGNGKYVLCNIYGSNGGAQFVTSSDAVTWTVPTVPVQANWRSVTFGNGTFVVVSETGYVCKSSDGINWTSQNITSSFLVGVTYSLSPFSSIVVSWSEELETFLVAGTGSNDTKTYLYTSKDGISFTNEGYFYGSPNLISSLTWSPVIGFLLANDESLYLSQPVSQTF